ncbi:MAG: NYN domain-containing protein, partial [bacterium]|nr:NYN domain-containing protein [bacterium]
EVLYTRPDIRTFVIVGGDRDYIPLVQHLQRQGRTVLIVTFRGNLSGDLLNLVGEKYFVDAANLLDEKFMHLIEHISAPTTHAQPVTSPSLLTPPVQKEVFYPSAPVDEPDTRRCLYILVNEFGTFPEIWLTPFLRRLNEEFPLLANHERRALIANLVAAGAIRVEKREGNPYPYSVAIINWDHPTVHEVNEPPTQ